MEAENLRSISINDLIIGENGKKFCFIIPSYQRGYRWDEEQVEKLLEDLLEFHKAKNNNEGSVGEFYCLQPIVVNLMDKNIVLKRLGVAYQYNENIQYIEVVDGQQRLTTIYILLKYLVVRNPIFFEIEYERDEKSNFTRRKFLQALNLNKSAEPKSIDEHYFIKAYDSIKAWFDSKSETDTVIHSNIEIVLKEKTKVIWYELPKNSTADCYLVFRNINNGKIPLTDAELVKAMLLNSKYFSPQLDVKYKIENDKIIRQEQERYARLWDEIQIAFNNEELWSFITGNHNFGVQTRIDFLFKIAVMQKEPDYKQDGTYKLFSYYENNLSKLSFSEKKEYIISVFEDIRKIYRTIKDWAENYEFYNYIGYIMTYKETGKTESEKSLKRIRLIVDLLNKYESETRPEFSEKLIMLIKEDFKCCGLDMINYEENRKEVEKLLMLFNITELNRLKSKFNFIIGKSGWSVEHIKAQHSQIVKNIDKIDFLNKEKIRIEKNIEFENDIMKKQKLSSVKSKIENMIELKNLDNEFNSLAEEIDKEIDNFDDGDMHGLGNLALLGKDDNSSLQNYPFYEKRKIMLGWLNDPQKNIPYSTVRVFQKTYSQQEFLLDYTKWGKADFNSYFSKQKELLKIFIQEVQE